MELWFQIICKKIYTEIIYQLYVIFITYIGFHMKNSWLEKQTQKIAKYLVLLRTIMTGRDKSFEWENVDTVVSELGASNCSSQWRPHIVVISRGSHVGVKGSNLYQYDIKQVKVCTK